MGLSKDRQELYAGLESMIGNTALVRYTGEVPNGNEILIKEECNNPFGSHYDRVYLAIFRDLEERGKIQPGDEVLETSSGTAARSYAHIGKLLGYHCHVGIPRGIDGAIVNAIAGTGAEMHFTPEKDYIAGFRRFIPRFLKLVERQGRSIAFLSHSQGERAGPGFSNNEVTLDALGGIAREVSKMTPVDIYVAASGNGSSILGPARVYGSAVQVIAFESVQSGVTFDLLHPGQYTELFGMDKGELPRHKLRGTSYPGVDFPHIKQAVEDGIITEVVLLSDQEVDANYRKIIGRNETEALLHWDSLRYRNYGPTTNAGIVVALDLADRVRGKSIVLNAYDYMDMHDI